VVKPYLECLPFLLFPLHFFFLSPLLFPSPGGIHPSFPGVGVGMFTGFDVVGRGTGSGDEICEGFRCKRGPVQAFGG
jgi:hypothetical protein